MYLCASAHGWASRSSSALHRTLWRCMSRSFSRGFLGFCLYLVYTRGVFFFVSREKYGDQSLIQTRLYISGLCVLSLFRVVYYNVVQTFFDARAFFFFSMMPLLFERRTAGSRRAGRRPNPVCTRRAKNGYDAKCVHEEEEEEEEEEVCRQFAFKRRKEERG